MMYMGIDLTIDTMNIWGQKRNITPRAEFYLDPAVMNKVKPNPVRELAPVVVNSTAIYVTWDRPQGLPISVEVNYELNYTSIWGASSTTVDGPGVHETVKAALSDLHPDTEYNITVRCKPEHGGFFSDAKWKLNKTNEAAPSAPPEMAEGSYKIQLGCDSKNEGDCVVTVMFKKIDEYDQNGVIRSHTLTVKGEGNFVRKETADEGSYQIIVKKLPARQRYTVFLRGETDVGPSPASVISLSTTPQFLPQNVVAEINESKTGVNMWWEKPDGKEIDTYTLFYCTEGKDGDNLPVCIKGDLEGISVDGNATSATLPYDTKDKALLYSIAANVDHYSSGMKEWLCLYHFDGTIPDVEFTLRTDQEKSLTVKIITEQTCDEQNPSGRILQYNISVECVQNQTICLEERTVTVPGSTKYYVIEDLEPYTEYNVTVIAIGNKDTKDQVKTHRTKESVPNSPPVDVTIQNVGCHFIEITWSPPPKEDWNGPTLNYTVTWQDESGRSWRKNTENTRLNLTSNVYGDTNYTISITAATAGGQSLTTPQQRAQTSICAPSGMPKPTVNILSSSQVEMEWEEPEHKNGQIVGYMAVAYYQTADGNPGNQTWNSTAKESDKFTMVCPDDVADFLTVNYTISAVTGDQSTHQNFTGPFSEPVAKEMCKPGSVYDILPLAIGVPIASVAFLVVLVLAITCRQKWYPDFKQWFRGGIPEEPPVIPDLEKDDLISDSTDPSYIDDWVHNLLVYVDTAPLIDEPKDDKDDYSTYPGMDSGDSTGSRIFIKGFSRDSGRSDKPDSGLGSQEPTSSSAGESEHMYERGQPDTIDETMGLVGGDLDETAVFESDPKNMVFQNKGYEAQSEQSDSSGIHSDKTSDSDSKSSSSASSGIGQEAPTIIPSPLGALGLFKNLTAADLETSDDEDDGCYQQVGMTRKPSCPKEFTQFEDIPTQNEDASNSEIVFYTDDLHSSHSGTSSPEHVQIHTVDGAQSPSPTPNHSARSSDISCVQHEDNLSDVEQKFNVCTSCRKRHEPNMKCGLTSPELRAHQRSRQKRIDSSCSDESIPLDVLNGTSNDFPTDTSPEVNPNSQVLSTFLGLNSNATTC